MKMASTNQVDLNKFPPQIKYIVSQEGAERFSYYGMRTILTIFMVQYLLFQKNDAVAIYHLFVSGCYLTPLLGAYIADRIWGKYKTILYLSLVYCLGHLVLAIWENTQGLYAGLFLIALGSGGIKPCVSAHVGDQFIKGQEGLLRKVFDLFYFMINFGSTASSLLTPVVLAKYGPGWAFGIPGVLMAIATLIFWLGRKHYVHVPPVKDEHSFGAMLVTGFKKQAGGVYDSIKAKHGAEKLEEFKAVVQIAKVYIGVILFWALFEQHGSTWVLQGAQMKQEFMGMTILPSQMQAMNPIMVMTMIPLFSFGLYPLIERMTGTEFTPLKKMGTGLFFAGTSFVAAGAIQYALDSGAELNIMWQSVQYFLITGSELLVSITGLEFSYTQAPRSMKSTIMSLFFLTVFSGSFLTAIIAKFNVFEGGNFYMFFAGLTFVFTLIFIWNAKKFEYKNFMEG